MYCAVAMTSARRLLLPRGVQWVVIGGSPGWDHPGTPRRCVACPLSAKHSNIPPAARGSTRARERRRRIADHLHGRLAASHLLRCGLEDVRWSKRVATSIQSGKRAGGSWSERWSCVGPGVPVWRAVDSSAHNCLSNSGLFARTSWEHTALDTTAYRLLVEFHSFPRPDPAVFRVRHSETL